MFNMTWLCILFLTLLEFCVSLEVYLPPIPQDLSTPVQQRIAIKGPKSISIAWNTYQELHHPCVDYGTSPEALSLQQCSAPSKTYAYSRTHFSVVVLSNLRPATTYYYKIQSTNSTLEQFQSPRAPGDPTPFTFNVVANLGVYGADGYILDDDGDDGTYVDPSLGNTTISRLTQNAPSYEFILHPGDLAYADAWYVHGRDLYHTYQAYESILETFYDQLAPVAARKPYMPGPGDHEAMCSEWTIIGHWCPRGQRNFTGYRRRFSATLPTAFPPPSSSHNATAPQNNTLAVQNLANPPFWYSFDYGLVHVVMLDTETDFPSAPDEDGGSANLKTGPFGRSRSQQLDFLRADLAAVDRSVTPWIVVAGHRPWYTVSGEACAACREAFEPILHRFGVDIAAFGHVGNSQRFNPIHESIPDINGLKNPKAPLYLVAGGAGNAFGLDKLGADADRGVEGRRGGDVWHPDYGRAGKVRGHTGGPEWKGKAFAWGFDEDFAYLEVGILNRTMAEVRFVRSRTGEVLDSVVLEKEHGEAFVRQ